MAKKSKKTNKNRALWILILLLIALGIGAALFKKEFTHNTSQVQKKQPFDFGSQSILLEGSTLVFMNGLYESEDKTHTAQITNRTVNNTHDRAAAILIDSPGGSGTFYYLIGAIERGGEEMYSTPILLGDRIKIVSVSISNAEEQNNGEIEVKFLDRPDDAPMFEEPSI